MPKTPDELLRLLHSTEHSFAERKTVNDSRDWLKTVVGFANTLDPSEEGVLFIGVTDKGEIESKPTNLDSLQKSFSEKMSNAYPPVYYTTSAITDGGRECLAVIVPGSTEKPHFGGKPYLREGSQTKVATSEQYEALLAQRTDKSREIQRWSGKEITLRIVSRVQGIAFVLSENLSDATIVACNRFFVTVRFNNNTWSYPLSRVELSFDHIRNRLELALLMTPYS